MSKLSPIGGALVFDLATRLPRTDRVRNNADVLSHLRPPPSKPVAPIATAATVREARTMIRDAAEALRQALNSLTRRLRTAHEIQWVGTPGRAAVVQGGVGSLGTYSTLAATREVNAQTSTERSSTAALGLDLSSPESASRISSTGVLGLDVTSPERPSTLDSTLALGLDITSPERVSHLNSNGSLGLNVTSPEARSTLASTAEANTAATSYGAVQTTFTKGGSTQTSLGNITGVYGGTGAAANATSLKLQITSGNETMGAAPVEVRVKVTDQNNTNLGTYTGMLAAGQSLSLGANIGLSVSFTAGSIIHNAITMFSVDKNTPTNVDPNAVFNNANVNLRPRFDNGEVTAGSFTVNGTSINVLANDTINTVLTRLNSAVPEVLASFNNDKVTFQTTANTEDDIVLGGDTSGFLAALKLSGAATVKGNLYDDQQVLAKTSQFGAVASGSFTINGVAIAVDRNADTLQSLIAKINNAGAGVSADYDAGTDQLKLTTLANTEDDIVVADDTTGFLAAARLSTGNTVKGNIRDDAQVLAKMSQFGAVTSGAFTINGVAIAVDRNTDTLQSLLAKINNAGAGVTAAYDADADKIRLTSLANTEDDIVVADDTTGFLAAGRLNTGNTVKGNIRDDAQVLAKTSQFGAVSSGTFTVNGVAIAVDADSDTLPSILARINAAGAGVTGSYDAEADRISLVSSANSEDDIVLGDDTTGFLAAAKLNNASTVRGNLRDDEQVLAKTTQFGSVVSGSFSVNGRSIAIDWATDSFASVIARINSSGAAVTASYDEATDKLVFTPDTPGATLVLDDDTSGFLAAARIAAGASGTRVNPDAAFNATGANAPLFEDGRGVVAGSFQVNGVAINVAANDSLRSVLAKISASAAGVTATFDAATEKVTLTAKSPSETDVTVANDTSGFLAAVKLDDTAASTEGVSTLDSVLARNAAFAAVTSGTITVNGKSIDVNPAVDTLSKVVAAINDLSGVVATLDSSSGRIRLKAEQDGGDLEISDTSGLLSALNIGSGKVAGTPSTLKRVETGNGRLVLDDPAAVSQTIAGAVAQVNDALEHLSRARNASPLFKYDTEDALRAAVTTLPYAAAQALLLVENNGTLRLNVNASQLANTLTEDPNALDEFFSGAQSLPTALDDLLVAYDETSAALPPIPESGTLTAAEVRQKFVLGEKTKAEFAQAQYERQLSLLDFALIQPASSDANRTWSFDNHEDTASANKTGYDFLAEKVKSTYGLSSEPDSAIARPSTTPWLTGFEPQNLYTASRAREIYGLGSGGADSQGIDSQLTPARLPRLAEADQGAGFSTLNYLLS